MIRSQDAEIKTVFELPDFRRLLFAVASTTLASRALAVVVGYQVYALTKSPFALGYLGLIEAIPALSLSLVWRTHRRSLRPPLDLENHALGSGLLCGGDRRHRRPADQRVVIDGALRCSLRRRHRSRICRAGDRRVGSSDHPAGADDESLGLVFQHLAVLRDLGAGSGRRFVPAIWGPAATFGVFAALFALSWIFVSRMQAYPVIPPPVGESIWQSITEGVKYVVRDQVLVGSMALDLFAVLFGGAIAILPVFASDILHVGPVELGFLNAAPNAGALVTMLFATRHPPLRHAGRNLLVAVGGFGIAMIVFALSTNFWLSLVALAVAGVCDGVSVVIRRSIVRLLSPKHLRGRIAAVGMVFIGASNELGALESGLAAGWLGTVRSVWAGGLLTLLIVGMTAIRAPLLRRLRLDKLPLSNDQETP